jgi:hypothetical protein
MWVVTQLLPLFYYKDYCQFSQAATLITSFTIYRCAAISVGITFQDLLQLRETADNTECYTMEPWFTNLIRSWRPFVN